MTYEMMPSQTDVERMREEIWKDDEEKFEHRVARLSRIKLHRIIPHIWFEVASTECRDLFRDGHFYGCICLSQSVAEGLAKFILEIHHVTVGKLRRPIEQCKKPRTCRALIKLLKSMKGGKRNGHPVSVLSERCLNAFDCIEGGDRDDFHHLNKGIITDRKELEQRAENCVMALYDIESELFGYDLNPNGQLTPHQFQYWPDRGQYARVYLRAY